MKRFATGIAGIVAILVAISGLAAPARAEAPATFALIIGVNKSPSPELLPLRYADDDAARYSDLLRTVGARTFLLATFDDNTRRLHPEALAEASPARVAQFDAAVSTIALEVERARRAGRPTSFMVFYAGHGGQEADGGGYVALEDGRLRGGDLVERLFDRVNADQEHLVVDACSAFLLVLGRGEGGKRRPLQGFAKSGSSAALIDRRDIGLLLSTSSGTESHEWGAFQAGVFSHEVRSGLFGAADADGDGLIEYGEIHAFIQRANESIPNERYRPQIYWRAPRGTQALLDVRAALSRRVEVRAAEGGHHYLEDPRGVRLADFHNGKSLNVRLLRPHNVSHLYLLRAWDGREYLLPDAVPVLSTATLTAQDARVGSRGAAHDAFRVLFALPFEGTGASGGDALVRDRPAPPVAAEPWSARRIVGWGLVVASALGAAGSAELLVSARAYTSQEDARARAYSRWAWLTAGAATVALASGVTVLLWPEAPPVELAASRQGVALGWHGRF